MPYNVPQSTPPAMSSSGQWMTIAQIISGLVGGNGGTPTAPSANQNAALAAGQGPLSAAGADAWQNNMFPQLTNVPGITSNSAPTPGYNTGQFGQPLGTQQSNSY